MIAVFKLILQIDTGRVTPALQNKIWPVLHSFCASHQHQVAHVQYCTTASYFPAQKQYTSTPVSLHAPAQRGTDADQTIYRLNLISPHLFLREALFHTKPPSTWESDATWTTPSSDTRQEECSLHEDKDDTKYLWTDTIYVQCCSALKVNRWNVSSLLLSHCQHTEYY